LIWRFWFFFIARILTCLRGLLAFLRAVQADRVVTAKEHGFFAAATGHKPTLANGSTDSNLPMSLGIPAVTLGHGGKSGDTHSRTEWFEPADAWKGPQTVLLTILQFDSSLR